MYVINHIFEDLKAVLDRVIAQPRSVYKLGCIGFGLTCFHSNFNGLNLLSNLHFHDQNRIKSTNSFMGWIELSLRSVVFQIKIIICFFNYKKLITQFSTITLISNIQIR